MTDDELEKLADIRNFDIKKSTTGNNRNWKDKVVKSFQKIAKKQIENGEISPDEFYDKRRNKRPKNRKHY